MDKPALALTLAELEEEAATEELVEVGVGVLLVVEVQVELAQLELEELALLPSQNVIKRPTLSVCLVGGVLNISFIT